MVFLIETEKMSSNKVFSFGRDHGYHGRLLSHGVVANHSLHVKENTLTGYCFTPQDGNALLSSVAATVQHYYKDTWKGFTKFVLWGTITVIAILVILALTLL